VRLIVPAAAGGSTDVMGRLLAAHLQTAWGQSAIVENRSGAGGTIGTSEVVRSKGDGHTILIGNPGPNAIAYSIFKNLTYKPEQLQPVSNMIRIPNIVSAHPSTKIKSIPELIAYLKANPDQLTYGSSGTGQSPHLTGAWFLQLTGLKMTHVPFRGAGPALQAGLAGDIQILFDNLYPSLPQVQDGKLNGLCVTTPERSEAAPDLPTMREAAPELAKFDVSSWFGVFLPKTAPAGVVEELNKQVKAMLDRDDVRKNIASMGARADYGTPQQFSDFVDAETRKFASIIEKEGLQMEVK
jgi:tripartite-type tricarboxylate transporter receptor subunit TctC